MASFYTTCATISFMKKAGVVAIIGRPNVGKSSLLNNLLGHKVAITSPKPQTTRYPLQAVYEDERGQIIFTDTPGINTTASSPTSRLINDEAEKAIGNKVDLILYLIDPTRARDTEENRTLGMVRKSSSPKILVINKIDIKDHRYLADYVFYEDEFEEIIKISALKHLNLNLLLDAIFKKLPAGKKLVSTTGMTQPALNLSSNQFVAEIIREKVFLLMQEEIPYTVNTSVPEIEERTNGTLYIKAIITTTHDKYKKMIIGKKGKMIKEIGINARKELETATGKKIYIDLTVEVNPHWQETT